jgi:hypothetical protein
MLVVRVVAAVVVFMLLVAAMIPMGVGVFVFSVFLLMSFVRIVVFGTHTDFSLLQRLLLWRGPGNGHRPCVGCLLTAPLFRPKVSPRSVVLYLLQRSTPGPVIPALTR